MPSYAFFQKKFIPLEEAKIGIMTHAFHYGTAIFEGIRGNWNAERKQTYIFRMKEHYERLINGCKVLKINLAYSIGRALPEDRRAGGEMQFPGRRLYPAGGLYQFPGAGRAPT